MNRHHLVPIMKHFITSFILFITISTIAISSSSCSGSDDDNNLRINDNNEELSESNIAEKMIIGKWRLEKIGSSTWTGKEKTMLFREDGTVTCCSERLNYHRKYTISQTTVDEGTIYCTVTILKEGEKDSIGIVNPQYWCMLQDNNMSLRDMNLYSVLDATEYYVRIE